MHLARVVTGVTLATALFWAASANAQVDGAENESESEKQSSVMDEIKVTVGPQGWTASELEMQRQEQIKEEVYAEMRMRERAEEELAWRQTESDLQKPESRIKWGYSPQAEYRMRRDNDFIYDLSGDQTRPATIFRTEF